MPSLPPGAWEVLFPRALRLVDEIQRYGGLADPFWTFGGGTVLMFRYGHRLSKDIDIFVPDPQHLGYVTPRLSDTAASLTEDYTETGLFVKLQFEDHQAWPSSTAHQRHLRVPFFWACRADRRAWPDRLRGQAAGPPGRLASRRMDPSHTAVKAAVVQPVMHFGRCELRLDTRELLLDGTLQPVRRQVFDLIAYLIAQRPRAVPHAEALRAVWQRAGVSPKMLARVVMEARRACGDAAEDPRIIVTVHGVGYRFAGTLDGVPGALQDDKTGDPPALVELRGLLARGMAELDAGRLGEARALAERALAQSIQLQSQAERVRALVLCSSVTMRDGTAEAAAKLAAQAWQIARGEGQPQLVAHARLAVGYVHLLAGDPALAIQHFEACREALSAPGCEIDLSRSLHMLSMAFRETGKPETGLKLCRRVLAMRHEIAESPHKINVDRTNEVMFLLSIGDELVERGQADQARAHFEEALALSDALLKDLHDLGGGPQLLSALGNRAFALVRLGRMDEAWQTFDRMTQGLPPVSGTASPIAFDRRRALVMLKATLLAGSGRYGEALRDLADLADAGQQTTAKRMLPRLYGMAKDIARRAGRLEEALDWADRQLAAQTALQTDQAASLARILEAELGTAELQAELDGARAQATALLQENKDLQRQVSLAAGVVPIAPTTGLADRQHLALVFSAPHRHARARGLPMCIGLLELVNLPALRAAHQPEVVQAVLRRAAELLGAQADVAYPAVDVGDGRVAFHVRDAGLPRAAELCELLLHRLRGQDWPAVRGDLAPRWRCKAVDLAGQESLDVPWP